MLGAWGRGNSGRERLLVCLDLQQGSLRPGQAPDGCLVNCRRLLAHARSEGWRVAHIHSRKPQLRDAAPIDGLQPLLSEPVLYRSGPSAFSNRAFCEMVEGGAVELVLIGYSMTSALIGTAMIAFDEGLPVMLVEDAICSAVLDDETRGAIEYLGLKAAGAFVTLGSTDGLIGAPCLRRVV
jgi:nicotinamidase-related amidase